MSPALALLASLLWGTSDFLGGTASRAAPVVQVLGLSQAAAAVLLVPLALLVGGHDAGFALPGVVAGAVGMTALLAFYRALSIGTMGVVAPVAALGVVVPVAWGLLQGEAPRLVQLAGMGLAVVGVVLASGPELRGGRGGTSLVLAVVAAVGFGVVLVLLAEGARSSVVLTLLTMRLTSVALLGVPLLRVARSAGAAPLRRLLPVVVPVGACDLAANGLYAQASATSGALVSVTSVLASLYPVVTVLLAFRIHGERLNGVQLAGVAGALGGVVLLAAG